MQLHNVSNLLPPSRVMARCVQLYSLIVVVACAGLHAGADRWWWAAPLAYGPRWPIVAPLALLLPVLACVSHRQRALWVAATVIAFGPLLGLCVPWRTWISRESPGFRVRVLTCNLSAIAGDFDRFDALLQEADPDVMVLPECSEKMFAWLSAKGVWRLEQKRSLCVASRWPVSRVAWRNDDGRLGYWGAFAVRCEISAPGGRIDLIGVHLETPREGLEELLWRPWEARTAIDSEIDRRARISALARSLLADSTAPAIIAGDFNLPVESAIYRRDWGQFANAYSHAGLGFGHTKRSRWFGVRIDHILADSPWRVLNCQVGPVVGSDHRPLIARLVLP